MLTVCAVHQVRAFRPSDLDELVNRDGMQLGTAMTSQQALEGPAWTATADEVPIGCAGVVLPWPGIGLCWMLVTDQLGTQGLWLTRIVRRILRDVVRHHDLHRLEAVAVNGVNGRWLEALGFAIEQDGTARQYLSDRRNVVRYEWVRD
jgi:hypothetical protein